MGRHPLADWLDAGDAAPADAGGPAQVGADEPDEPSGGRRRWLLLAAAVLPWMVLLAVLVRAGGSEPETAAPVLEHVDEATEVTPGPVTGAEALEQPPADMAAAAAVAVRMEMTRSAADGTPARYVDLVAPEGLEREGDLWIARMLAVVLEGEGGRWDSTRVRRFAVALRREPADGRARLVGRPWSLPEEPVDTADRPRWAAVADRDGEVAEALAAAGFTGVTELEVEAAESVLRARFVAGDPPQDNRVWLSDEAPPRVLGTLPQPPEPAR